MSKQSVVVAMSGGVDSSVAAALLVDAGYDVTGVMLKLWRGDDVNTNSGCCSVDAASDARRVADHLAIPFYVLNLAERFEETVIRDFHDSYARGDTPNPCVRCNQWIKFDALLDRAMALGADRLATGHYARVVEGGGGKLRLLRGVDRAKDQSYVLWMLDQARLERTLFPVGHLDKSETRSIAAQIGLRTAAKPDSQEICFVRGGELGSYLDRHIAGSGEPGDVVDGDGRVVGRHPGAARFTIGQRKGLGVSLGMPVFVTAVDTRRNLVTVGDRADLAVAAIDLDEVGFTGSPAALGDRVELQYRAHGETHAATVTSLAPLRIEPDVPVEAVARGQSAALYNASDPDELIGGGVIGRVHATALRAPA